MDKAFRQLISKGIQAVWLNLAAHPTIGWHRQDRSKADTRVRGFRKIYCCGFGGQAEPVWG